MSAVSMLALTVTVIGVISAVVRAVQTRNSPTVTGVSSGFAWLGLAANALWLAYGIRMNVMPQIIVSIVWGAVFAYVLWRINDRHFTARTLAGMTATVGAGMALAFGLSGDAAGWVGGLLILGSTAPQAWKIWRTRDIAGTAPAAWGIALGIGVLWCVYGYVAALPPVLILNAAYVVLVAVILAGIARAVTNPAVSTVPVEEPAAA